MVLPSITALPVVAVATIVIVPLLAVKGAMYQPVPLMPLERTHPLKPMALIVIPPLAEVTGACNSTDEFALLVMPLMTIVLFA